MSSLSKAAFAGLKALLLAVPYIPVDDVHFTDAELEYDFEALRSIVRKPETESKVALCTGTRKISIRVSNRVLNKIQDKAREGCTGYQTLINRMLGEASSGW